MILEAAKARFRRHSTFPLRGGSEGRPLTFQGVGPFGHRPGHSMLPASAGLVYSTITGIDPARTAVDQEPPHTDFERGSSHETGPSVSWAGIRGPKVSGAHGTRRRGTYFPAGPRAGQVQTGSGECRPGAPPPQAEEAAEYSEAGPRSRGLGRANRNPGGTGGRENVGTRPRSGIPAGRARSPAVVQRAQSFTEQVHFTPARSPRHAPPSTIGGASGAAASQMRSLCVGRGLQPPMRRR